MNRAGRKPSRTVHRTVPLPQRSSRPEPAVRRPSAELVARPQLPDAHQLVPVLHELRTLRRSDLDRPASLDHSAVALSEHVAIRHSHLPPLQVRQPVPRQASRADARWIERKRHTGHRLRPPATRPERPERPAHLRDSHRGKRGQRRAAYLGDPVADELWKAMSVRPEGMTRTEPARRYT